MGANRGDQREVAGGAGYALALAAIAESHDLADALAQRG
jgi:hypothetical protein